MDKVILITPERTLKEIEIDFENSNDNSVNKTMKEYIGNDCRCYEIVPPYFLHNMFQLSAYPTTNRPYGFLLVIDEEGKFKDNKENEIATVLYGNDNDNIVGNALLVSTKKTASGEVDFCGIPSEWLNIIEKVLAKAKKVLEQI